MGLTICPECNKEISAIAKKCIHCGYKLKTAKKETKEVLWLVILTLQVLALLFSCIPGVFNRVEIDDVSVPYVSPFPAYGLDCGTVYPKSYFPSITIYSGLYAVFAIFAVFVFSKKLIKKTIEKRNESILLPFCALLFQLLAMCSVMSYSYIDRFDNYYFAKLGWAFWICLLLQIVAVSCLIFFLLKERTEKLTLKPLLKKRYIIEIVLLVVLLITPWIISSAVSLDTEAIRATQEPEQRELNYQEVIDAAKQEVVNQCCYYSNVDTVSIEFATQEVTGTNSSGYTMVELAGYYYPKDRYGDYGDEKKFDFVVNVDRFSGYAYTDEKNIW